MARERALKWCGIFSQGAGTQRLRESGDTRGPWSVASSLLIGTAGPVNWAGPVSYPLGSIDG